MKRIILLVAVAVMIALMLAVMAGPALAAPGNNGKGATNANRNALPGITKAIDNTGGGCDILC